MPTLIMDEEDSLERIPLTFEEIRTQLGGADNLKLSTTTDSNTGVFEGHWPPEGESGTTSFAEVLKAFGFTIDNIIEAITEFQQPPAIPFVKDIEQKLFESVANFGGTAVLDALPTIASFQFKLDPNKHSIGITMQFSGSEAHQVGVFLIALLAVKPGKKEGGYHTKQTFGVAINLKQAGKHANGVPDDAALVIATGRIRGYKGRLNADGFGEQFATSIFQQMANASPDLERGVYVVATEDISPLLKWVNEKTKGWLHGDGKADKLLIELMVIEIEEPKPEDPSEKIKKLHYGLRLELDSPLYVKSNPGDPTVFTLNDVLFLVDVDEEGTVLLTLQAVGELKSDTLKQGFFADSHLFQGDTIQLLLGTDFTLTAVPTFDLRGILKAFDGNMQDPDQKQVALMHALPGLWLNEIAFSIGEVEGEVRLGLGAAIQVCPIDKGPPPFEAGDGPAESFLILVDMVEEVPQPIYVALQQKNWSSETMFTLFTGLDPASAPGYAEMKPILDIAQHGVIETEDLWVYYCDPAKLHTIILPDGSPPPGGGVGLQSFAKVLNEFEAYFYFSGSPTPGKDLGNVAGGLILDVTHIPSAENPLITIEAAPAGWEKGQALEENPTLDGKHFPDRNGVHAATLANMENFYHSSNLDTSGDCAFALVDMQQRLLQASMMITFGSDQGDDPIVFGGDIRFSLKDDPGFFLYFTAQNLDLVRVLGNLAEALAQGYNGPLASTVHAVVKAVVEGTEKVLEKVFDPTISFDTSLMISKPGGDLKFAFHFDLTEIGLNEALTMNPNFSFDLTIDLNDVGRWFLKMGEEIGDKVWHWIKGFLWDTVLKWIAEKILAIAKAVGEFFAHVAAFLWEKAKEIGKSLANMGVDLFTDPGHLLDDFEAFGEAVADLLGFGDSVTFKTEDTGFQKTVFDLGMQATVKSYVTAEKDQHHAFGFNDGVDNSVHYAATISFWCYDTMRQSVERYRFRTAQQAIADGATFELGEVSRWFGKRVKVTRKSGEEFLSIDSSVTINRIDGRDDEDSPTYPYTAPEATVRFASTKDASEEQIHRGGYWYVMPPLVEAPDCISLVYQSPLPKKSNQLRFDEGVFEGCMNAYSYNDEDFAAGYGVSYDVINSSKFWNGKDYGSWTDVFKAQGLIVDGNFAKTDAGNTLRNYYLGFVRDRLTETMDTEQDDWWDMPEGKHYRHLLAEQNAAFPLLRHEGYLLWPKDNPQTRTIDMDDDPVEYHVPNNFWLRNVEGFNTSAFQADLDGFYLADVGYDENMCVRRLAQEKDPNEAAQGGDTYKWKAGWVSGETLLKTATFKVIPREEGFILQPLSSPDKVVTLKDDHSLRVTSETRTYGATIFSFQEWDDANQKLSLASGITKIAENQIGTILPSSRTRHQLQIANDSGEAVQVVPVLGDGTLGMQQPEPVAPGTRQTIMGLSNLFAVLNTQQQIIGMWKVVDDAGGYLNLASAKPIAIQSQLGDLDISVVEDLDSLPSIVQEEVPQGTLSLYYTDTEPLRLLYLDKQGKHVDTGLVLKPNRFVSWNIASPVVLLLGQTSGEVRHIYHLKGKTAAKGARFVINSSHQRDYQQWASEQADAHTEELDLQKLSELKGKPFDRPINLIYENQTWHRLELWTVDTNGKLVDQKASLISANWRQVYSNIILIKDPDNDLWVKAIKVLTPTAMPIRVTLTEDDIQKAYSTTKGKDYKVLPAEYLFRLPFWRYERQVWLDVTFLNYTTETLMVCPLDYDKGKGTWVMYENMEIPPLKDAETRDPGELSVKTLEGYTMSEFRLDQYMVVALKETGTPVMLLSLNTDPDARISVGIDTTESLLAKLSPKHDVVSSWHLGQLLDYMSGQSKVDYVKNTHSGKPLYEWWKFQFSFINTSNEELVFTRLDDGGKDTTELVLEGKPRPALEYDDMLEGGQSFTVPAKSDRIHVVTQPSGLDPVFLVHKPGERLPRALFFVNYSSLSAPTAVPVPLVVSQATLQAADNPKQHNLKWVAGDLQGKEDSFNVYLANFSSRMIWLHTDTDLIGDSEMERAICFDYQSGKIIAVNPNTIASLPVKKSDGVRDGFVEAKFYYATQEFLQGIMYHDYWKRALKDVFSNALDDVERAGFSLPKGKQVTWRAGTKATPQLMVIPSAITANASPITLPSLDFSVGIGVKDYGRNSSPVRSWDIQTLGQEGAGVTEISQKEATVPVDPKHPIIPVPPSHPRIPQPRLNRQLYGVGLINHTGYEVEFFFPQDPSIKHEWRLKKQPPRGIYKNSYWQEYIDVKDWVLYKEADVIGVNVHIKDSSFPTGIITKYYKLNKNIEDIESVIAKYGYKKALFVVVSVDFSSVVKE